VPYSTVVAGTTITASWGNANVRDQVVTPFASRSARNSAIASPIDGMIAAITGDDVLSVYNSSAWLSFTPLSANVATNESTSSSTYTALATAGPSVTIETGTKALVILTAYMSPATQFSRGYMSVAVSGATTLAASDNFAVTFEAPNAGGADRQTAVALIDTLTAGVNTFTSQYRVAGGGSCSYQNRNLTVIGLI
jgi:hypothetical protein